MNEQVRCFDSAAQVKGIELINRCVIAANEIGMKLILNDCIDRST
jgi:hypothetical protein